MDICKAASRPLPDSPCSRSSSTNRALNKKEAAEVKPPSRKMAGYRLENIGQQSRRLRRPPALFFAFAKAQEVNQINGGRFPTTI